jgi:hypothetical protein
MKPQSRRTRRSPAATVAVAAAFVALASVGCATDAARTARPSEVETREAYFGTPVIVAEQGGRVAIGTTRRALTAKLGTATISYLRRAGRTYHECIIYPINGTQRWDRYGTPEADEWEFCFDRDDRVTTKRRIRTRMAPGSSG